MFKVSRGYIPFITSVRSPSTISSSFHPRSSSTAGLQNHTCPDADRTNMTASVSSATSRSAHLLRFVKSKTTCWFVGGSLDGPGADGADGRGGSCPAASMAVSAAQVVMGGKDNADPGRARMTLYKRPSMQGSVRKSVAAVRGKRGNASQHRQRLPLSDASRPRTKHCSQKHYLGEYIYGHTAQVFLCELPVKSSYGSM